MKLLGAGLFLGAVLALAACGGGGKAYVPVDSPLRPWQPPDEVADEPTEQAPAATPAPAPVAAPTPAPKK